MMISPSEKDYKETKLIKQGISEINPDFTELANWINSTFKVTVISVFYDIIEGKENQPRLTVILEYQKDELKFRNGFLGNYNTKKQKIIAGKYRELVGGKSITSFYESTSSNIADLQYETDNILVVFTSFEPSAKDEANSSIPDSEIKKLKADLCLNDLWEIYRQFSVTTFFFYTNNQVDEYTTNRTIENLSMRYLKLLNKYDEFGYFKSDTYSIMLDSKENFDEKYQSSWFYYSR